MHLSEIQKQCIEDSEDWFPMHARSLEFFTICLAGETGEFANQVKKHYRDGAYNLDQMREELTDAFIYLCNIAEILGMDLGEWYERKRARNVGRFGGIQS